MAKLNADGSALVYATYLGGSSFDLGRGIAVDASGKAWITGRTGSTNFPLSANALDGPLGGLADGFVTKLDPNGSALLYSSYLGGSSAEGANAVAVGTGGDAYVTGASTGDFPTTVGAFDRVGTGGDAFVARLDPTGTAFRYSTFLGGSAGEEGFAIAVDGGGNAYVTGFTSSSDFPTTAVAFDTTYNGSDDVFVTKLDDAGFPGYSTYLGGSVGTSFAQDIGWGIATDAAGNAFVAGHTNSTNFPTAGAYDDTLAGIQDGFVTKLNPAGSALVYSTYLGGSSGTFAEQVAAIAVDAEGSAYVVGGSSASDFPTTPDAAAASSGGVLTLFLTKLDASGASLRYSTYLPGAEGPTSSRPGSGGVAVCAGAAYVTGLAAGAPFLPTPGAFDTSHDGAGDAFVTKIDTGGPPLPALVTLSPATDTNPVGTSHTVTAAVSDEDGDPLEDVVVRFGVTGSVTASGDCATAASGECEFAYEGPGLPGADLIAAFADTDADGVHDPDEPADEASNSWVLPVSTPGQASGGGNFEAGGDRIAFGFSVRSGERGMRGNCSVVDRVADVMVQCTDATAFVIDDNAVTVYGNALVNGIPTTYRIDAVDNASRGRGADTFSIQTASGYTRSGTLAGGNVRVA